MMEKKITPYDKRTEYDKFIRDKVEELRMLCYERDIPMFFTAAVKNSQTDTVYETVYESAMVNDDVRGLLLCKDHISDMVKVLNDFYVVKATKPVDADDFLADSILEFQESEYTKGFES